MGSKKTLILLGSIVFLLYVPFLGNAFVSDDIQGIVQQVPTWTWLRALGWPSFIHLNVLLQYLLSLLFGLVPWPFRLLNILVHTGSVVLVYLLVTRISQHPRIGFVAALVFAVHPLVIESVTWISGGVYSLYSLFFLFSLYLYILASKKHWLYVGSLVSFLLSLCTSEKAISLVFVFIVYEWFFGTLKQQWKKLIPFFVLSSSLILFYGLRIGERMHALATTSYQPIAGLYNPFVQIPIAVSSYLSLFVFPTGLTLYHSELSFAWWDFLLRVLVTLGFVGCTIYTFVKRKAIGFWLCWFFIALVPMLTPFKVGWIVAERYVYLGLIGLCAVGGILFDVVMHRKRWYVPAVLVGCLAIMFFCTQTVRRNSEWRNEDTLWVATAKTSPSHPATWNNMGDVYARHGDQQQAARMFLKAIALNPQYADAYHNLGASYLRMRKFPEAKQRYAQALSMYPALWQSYRDLAVIAYEEHDVQMAKTYLGQALQFVPNDPILLKLQSLMQ